MSVAYTYGPTPLPPSPSGEGKNRLADDDLEARDLIEFLLDAIATYRRLRGIPVANLVGHTITVNLAALANLVTVD